MVEPFTIAIDLLMQKTALSANNLIDSRADLNIISWEAWNAMGQPQLMH